MSRTISEATKKRIAGIQYYKCKNSPGSNLKGLENFNCPLWKVTDHPGSFTESGYDIDHIEELSISSNNSVSNPVIITP